MGLGQSSKAPAADDTGEGELRSSFLFTDQKVKQGWRAGEKSWGALILSSLVNYQPQQKRADNLRLI